MQINLSHSNTNQFVPLVIRIGWLYLQQYIQGAPIKNNPVEKNSVFQQR